MTFKRSIFLLVLIVMVLGCKSEVEQQTEAQSHKMVKSAIHNLPENKAGEVVKKAIDKMGGMAEWENKKTLSYTKIIRQYDSLGNQIREIEQLHEYRFHPLQLKISWKEGGDKFEVLNNGQQAWKFKNGMQQKSEVDKNSAWNSTFGSHYVVSMPFKLTDKGTILEYVGIDSLHNGQKVHSVKTTYEQGAGSSAGFHTWWYYFDLNDYTPAGNFLDFGDGFSYIVNESFTNIDGITLPHIRKSYSTNADRVLLYLTTDYEYTDYEFNKRFDQNYFEIGDQ